MKSFLRPEQAQKVSPAAAGAAHPAVSGLRRRDVQTAAVVDPSAIVDAATAVAAHLPLAYEPVALPCSMMKCGDVLHRRLVSAQASVSKQSLPPPSSLSATAHVWALL
jgi:hypothetical protein